MTTTYDRRLRKLEAIRNSASDDDGDEDVILHLLWEGQTPTEKQREDNRKFGAYAKRHPERMRNGELQIRWADGSDASNVG